MVTTSGTSYPLDNQPILFLFSSFPSTFIGGKILKFEIQKPGSFQGFGCFADLARRI